MNLTSVKLELAKYILNTEDKEIINYIKAVVDVSAENWWENLPDEIKQSVEKGLQESVNGETISHNEAMQKYSKWLKK